MIREKRLRSVVKAVSWRVCATLITATVAYAITKQLALSIEIGFIDLLVKLLVYYVHERGWGYISWGTLPHPLSSIPIKEKVAAEDLEEIKKKLEDLGYL